MLPERLEEKITKTNGCWLWNAATNSKGYGVSWDGSRTVYAHRYVYELLKSEIPEGLHIDHLCRVVNCVNPDHLEPVTCKENVRRGDVSLRHLSKTHCPKGHPYSGNNLITEKNGWRKCRVCVNAGKRRRRENSS